MMLGFGAPPPPPPPGMPGQSTASGLSGRLFCCVYENTFVQNSGRIISKNNWGTKCNCIAEWVREHVVKFVAGWWMRSLWPFKLLVSLNEPEPPSSFLLPPHYCGLGACSIPFRAIVNNKQCEMSGLFMLLVIHCWMGDVQDSQGVSASEMTYIVLGGALNSTHSLPTARNSNPSWPTLLLRK